MGGWKINVGPTFPSPNMTVYYLTLFFMVVVVFFNIKFMAKNII